MTANYEGLILTFILGLISGLSIEFLRHSLSKRRKKEEDFLPHMRKLYGILCRILRKKEAQHLMNLHNKLINTKIEEKKREIALKDLQLEDSEFRRELGPLAMAETFFWHSYNCLLDVIEECRIFVDEYSKIEEKGLIPTLKKYHVNLYRSLWDFHSYAQTIVEHTNKWKIELIDARENGERGFETILKEENIASLNGLNIAISNLFRSGSQLEKDLEKII